MALCMAVGASAQEPRLTCTIDLTKEIGAYYMDHVPVAISHVYSSRRVAGGIRRTVMRIAAAL